MPEFFMMISTNGAEWVERLGVLGVLIWFMVYVLRVTLPSYSQKLADQGVKHKNEIDEIHKNHKRELENIHSRHEERVSTIVNQFRTDLSEERANRAALFESLLHRANFACPLVEKNHKP